MNWFSRLALRVGFWADCVQIWFLSFRVKEKDCNCLPPVDDRVLRYESELRRKQEEGPSPYVLPEVSEIPDGEIVIETEGRKSLSLPSCYGNVKVEKRGNRLRDLMLDQRDKAAEDLAHMQPFVVGGRGV